MATGGDLAHIDFETRSPVDLAKCGVYKYAEHPLTGATMIAYSIGDASVQGVHLDYPMAAPETVLARLRECPPDLAAHVAAGRDVVAHNAPFELRIWAMLRERNPRGWPKLRPEQMLCTMAEAQAMSLPAKLEHLAKALRLDVAKDMDGHKLMLRLCKPRRPRKGEDPDAILWHGTDAEFERMLDYCKTDVAVECSAFGHLTRLSPTERATWVLTQHVNDRGVCVDVDAIEPMRAAADRAKAALDAELRTLTKGEVKTANSIAALRAWLASAGLDVPDLSKDTVARTLRDVPNVPDECRRALEIRRDAAKSSTAKLDAMARCAGRDGAARGLLAYHGASTGRFAGRLIQTQNMMRPPKGFDLQDARDVIEAAKGGARCDAYLALVGGDAMSAIAASMRAMLVARPGHVFIDADYSNIEGRALAWSAGETWKLRAFREFDADPDAWHRDLYVIAYASSFGIDAHSVTKDQRSIGKVQELALGYQGAHGAFVSMAKNYGIRMGELAEAVLSVVSKDVRDRARDQYWRGATETAAEKLAALHAEAASADPDDDTFSEFPTLEDLADEIARGNRYGLDCDVWSAIRIIVDGWRAAHPRTVQYWYDLDEGSIEATASPGRVVTVNRVRYLKRGQHLFCRLPSGRLLTYPYARVETQKCKFTGNKVQKLVFEGVSSRTRKWAKQTAYGGHLAENNTQAIARDVLTDAHPKLETAGYPIVMHIHDQHVSEVRADLIACGERSADEMAAIMCDALPWADGFPITVGKPSITDRFWKD